MAQQNREKFKTHVNADCLSALRGLAQSEGRQLQALVDEANDFVWPGPNRRPATRGDPASVASGMLPPGFMSMLRDRRIARYRNKRPRNHQGERLTFRGYLAKSPSSDHWHLLAQSPWTMFTPRAQSGPRRRLPR